MSNFKLINPEDYVEPRRHIDRVFLHCSASDAKGKDYEKHGLAETIERWHRQRGWAQIGYHYVIDKEGNIITGRGLERTPAAQSGHNAHTIAICLHGLDKCRFTESQYGALRRLCKAIDGGVKRDRTFHGHCEVSRKACPVFDYKQVLRLDAAGRLGC